MKKRSRTQIFLLCLAMLGFLAQSINVAADQQHSRNNDPAAMKHMNHDVHSAINHHTDSSSKQHNAEHSNHDCCNQQCDCDMAHCSSVFALFSMGWALSDNTVFFHKNFKPKLTTITINSLYRPPIA